MNQGKLEAVKQEMARANVNILGISELKWTGMGEFNSDDRYIYYCGQKSLRRNGVVIMVNKRVQNAVLGYNLKTAGIFPVYEKCTVLPQNFRRKSIVCIGIDSLYIHSLLPVSHIWLSKPYSSPTLFPKGITPALFICCGIQNHGIRQNLRPLRWNTPPARSGSP